MGRRSGGRKTLIPVVGHIYKTVTNEKWARQYCRRGKGQIIDGVLFCFRSGVKDRTDLGDPLPRLLIKPVDIVQVDGTGMEYRVKSSDGFAVLQGERGVHPSSD